jgi:hypothetical protein
MCRGVKEDSEMEKKARLDGGLNKKRIFQDSPEVLQRHILSFLNGKELVLLQSTSEYFNGYISGISNGILNLWSAELVRLEHLRFRAEVDGLFYTGCDWKAATKKHFEAEVQFQRNLEFFQGRWKKTAITDQKQKKPYNMADFMIRLYFRKLF